MRSVLKIHNMMIIIALVTIIAIMYVNQQVLVYQMGLKVKEDAKVYSKLVDQNRILVYNVLNLRSPVNLEAKLLAKKVELDMPRKWQVVKLKGSPEKLVSNIAVKKGLFASLFSLGREAEASPNVNSF